jgi:hypothetical protein
MSESVNPLNRWIEPLKTFKEHVEARGLDSYPSIEIRTIEIKSPKGQWFIVRAELLLGVNPSQKNGSNELHATQHVRRRKSKNHLDGDYFQLFLENLGRGIVTDGEEQIHVAPQIFQNNMTTYPFSPQGGPSTGRPHQIWSIANGSHGIESAVSGCHTHVLDAELMASNPPELSFEAACESNGLSRQRVMYGDSGVQLVALCPLIVNSQISTITDQGVLVYVEIAQKIDKRRVSISMLVLDETQARKSYAVSDADIIWANLPDQPGWIRGEIKYAFEKRARACWVSVNLDAKSTHASYISSINLPNSVRGQVIAALDKDFIKLKAQVFDTKGKEFEYGVANLLFLLGFSATQAGGGSKQEDAPDIVAVTQNGSILVIECTSTTLNHESKLSKLVKRRKAVQDAFVTQGSESKNVLSVIVSQLTKEELASDLRAAADARVLVITRENLLKFFERLQENSDPDELVRKGMESLSASRQIYGIDAKNLQSSM